MTDYEFGRFAFRTFSPIYPTGDANDGYVLGPVSGRGHCWEGGVCKAECLRSTRKNAHPAPYEHCNCGIYGTLNLQHLIVQYPCESRSIVAVIAAEGQTILGSRGLRTQYARVVAYWTPPEGGLGFGIDKYVDDFVGMVGRKARRQFPDAKHFDSLFGMASAYGLPLTHDEIAPHDTRWMGNLFHNRDHEYMGWPREFKELFPPLPAQPQDWWHPWGLK